MDFTLYDFLNLVGALGFFIYGMKLMSESIQKVAGSKMREILRAMTSNRFKAVLTGFFLTSLVQSSSATTVLVVSFVNAGLLSLVESIGVIMGANIGTTITAWLISIIGFKVKIANYALPIIAIGFPLLFMNKNKLKAWGEVLIGFALLFIGLAYLKDSVPDLKSNPEILAYLSSWTDLGFISILIFVVIGTIITLTVQSSSAAMALTLVAANNGWVPFDLAAAMVLGENIGTTITANLAAIVANIHAKRAALAHLIFNVFGVIWIILLMPFFLNAIDGYMLNNYGSSPFNDPEAIPIGLSVFHTTFNVINTLLLVNFVGFIAKVVVKILPSKGDDEVFSLEHIGTGLMTTGELSIEEASKEVAKFGAKTREMAGFMRELIKADKPKRRQKLLSKIKKYEEITDHIESEVTSYLIKVAQDQLGNESTLKVYKLNSITHELERIGDILYQLSRDFSALQDDNRQFSSQQIELILLILDAIDEAFEVMNINLNTHFQSVSSKLAYEKESRINDLRNQMRNKHLKSMDQENYNVKVGSVYKDFYYSFERIGDHIINVTEAITGEKINEQLEEVEERSN